MLPCIAAPWSSPQTIWSRQWAHIAYSPVMCMQCVAVSCRLLQCVAACCSVVQCVEVYCRVLQHVGEARKQLWRHAVLPRNVYAVCWAHFRVLQCIEVRCSVLQFVAAPGGSARTIWSRKWAHIAYCPVVCMQCVAVRCRMLQCVAALGGSTRTIWGQWAHIAYCPVVCMRCVAVCCRMLQCVAAPGGSARTIWWGQWGRTVWLTSTTSLSPLCPSALPWSAQSWLQFVRSVRQMWVMTRSYVRHDTFESIMPVSTPMIRSAVTAVREKCETDMRHDSVVREKRYNWVDARLHPHDSLSRDCSSCEMWDGCESRHSRKWETTHSSPLCQLALPWSTQSWLQFVRGVGQMWDMTWVVCLTRHTRVHYASQHSHESQIHRYTKIYKHIQI